MYIPEPGTIREKIARLISEMGPLTATDIRKHLRKNGEVKLDESGRVQITNSICALFSRGALIKNEERGSAYALAPYLIEHYGNTEVVIEKEPELVKPPFEVLKRKNIPSTAARRNDALPPRDVGYKNGSIDFNSRVGYVLRG